MLKLFLIVTIHIVLLWHLRYIAWPENLAWPYLNLNGFSFYKDIFLIYTPLYWFSLSAFFKLFGLSILNLKLFSYVVIVLSDVLLYYVAGKKTKALNFYVPLQIFFEGNGLWVDQFLVPFFLLAFICLQKKKFFLLGVFLGISLLVKQTALYFVLTILTISYFQTRSLKQVVTTLGGILIPIAILVSALSIHNTLWDFYRSAVDYIAFFHNRHPLQFQLPSIRQSLVVTLSFLPAILIGFRKSKYALCLLTLSAALGVFTRFEFFHLQPALPFLALLFASTWWSYLIFPFFLILYGRFLINNFGHSPRFLSNEIFTTSKHLKEIFRNKEQTLFINSYDHYYFLTDTLPNGKFFVPSTPWTMDYPGNQEKILSKLKAQPPRIVVINPCFKVRDECYKPQKVLSYIEKNYVQVSKTPDGAGVFEYNPVASP